MTLSLKKSIFLFLFACFQILFVFSQATSFELIAISLFMAFLLFYFQFFKLKIILDFKVGVLWVGLMLFLLISSLFTHSIPLSLDIFIFYMASFCTFVFFRSLSLSKLFSKDDFAFIFLIIGVVFSMFFIAFFSFPSLSSFLSSVNILAVEFGHSHFAALLLLFIPLGWWFVFSDKYLLFRFRQSILILFYVLLILTFGRFAIFLGLVQLPFLFKFSNNKKFKKKYIYFAGFILLLALVAAILFSLNIDKNCSVKEFKVQVCKPISKEIRLEYFKQALLSFKDNPFIGYGPGTFALITRKYNPIAQYSSIYAHNAFLQVFAESGLFVGVLYLLLIVYLFKNMFALVKKDRGKFSLNYFIFLGLASLFVNAFIDFDWNLFPTYQITLILIALVLWDYPKKKVIKNAVFLRMFWTFLTLLLILLGSINILTKVLITNEKTELAFKIFPYFYSQSKFFNTEKNFSKEQKQLFYKIYENHDEFILDNIKKSNSIEEKKELYGKLIGVSPWAKINVGYYKILQESGDYKNLGIISQKGLGFLEKIEERGDFQSYRRKIEVMDYLYESANYHMKNGELEIASEYYRDIFDSQEWIFHTEPLEFLYFEGSDSNLIGLFLHRVGVKIDSFGKNQGSIVEWYLDDFEKKYFINDPKDIQYWIEFNGDRKSELWFHTSVIANSYYESNVEINDDLAKESLDLWHQYWLEFMKVDSPNDLSREYQFKLMNGLFLHEMDGMARVIQSYLYEEVLP